MKNYLRILLIIATGCLYSYKTWAQTAVLRLPVVGDTIDYQEKEKYLLFEDIPNKDYLFSVVSQRYSDTIITHYTKSTIIEIKADRQSISSILTNISRLDAYYHSLADTTGKPRKDYSLVSNPDKIRLEDPNLKPGLQVKKKELKKEYTKGQSYRPYKATPIEKKTQYTNTMMGFPQATFNPR